MTARRRLLITWAALGAGLVPAAGAAAAGAPVPSGQSSRLGVVAPGGTERLVTRRDGPDTQVLALRRGDRQVLRSGRIDGRWLIPAAALDGANTGLSVDEGTLVLVHRTRSFPSARTRLLVLDARRLEVRRRITLDGFFTVDAISPDGGAAYLVQYIEGNVLDYRVRALDTATGALVAGDIVDPREPDEQMGGIPYTRVMSPDGRWSYTLYGGGEEAFIHALDTVGATAACIDLEMLAPGGDFSQTRLSVSSDGSTVFVRQRGKRVAIIDAETFAVREPGEASEAAPATATPVATTSAAPAREPTVAADDEDSGWPTVLIVAGVAALAAAGAFLLRHRREPGEDVTMVTRTQ